MQTRRLFWLTLCALPLTLGSFSPDRAIQRDAVQRDDDDDKPYQTKTFSGNIALVRAETSGGSLRVEGGSGNEVKVEMYVRPNNWNGRDNLSKEEIEERLRDYDISIRQEGNAVVATAKRKNSDSDFNWKRSLSIGFRFYTPRNVGTDLRTSGGSIRLSRLAGQQDFRTSGGSLHVEDVEGDINGRTSGGSIHLANCRRTINMTTSGGSIHADDSNGTMVLKTSGGSVQLKNLRGDIDATTSGGSVRAEGIEGELMTGTSGGSIRLADIMGSVEARTSGGGIEADIRQVGKFVRLSSSSGSVRVRMPMDKGLDLDLRGNRVNIPERLSRFEGDIEKDRVRGRLNGGGIPVAISAGSGTVSLNQ